MAATDHGGGGNDGSRPVQGPVQEGGSARPGLQDGPAAPREIRPRRLRRRVAAPPALGGPARCRGTHRGSGRLPAAPARGPAAGEGGPGRPGTFGLHARPGRAAERAGWHAPSAADATDAGRSDGAAARASGA
ncbi:unnamed protein product, partial [Prorocentrum cordatum]